MEGSMALIREEDDDDFRSCCEDEEVWKETDDPVLVMKEESRGDVLDEFSVKMYFKGLSINGIGGSGSSVSGIGVIIERSSTFPLIKVQKKLEFHVEEPVADCLALMDGLTECLRNNIRRVFAFTDSELLYQQISDDKEVEIPLVAALKERILEHSSKLEGFVMKRVPSADMDAPSKLAQVAMGVISFTPKEGVGKCMICCEDKPCLVMITLKCSHEFCSGCMRSYAEKKVQSSHVPFRCPQETCKYFVSGAECKSFLTSASQDSLEKALREAEERASSEITSPQSERWRCCQQCRAMIERTRGCYRMSCRCGQELCYSCAAEYNEEGQQRCECAFWDEEHNSAVDRVTQSLQESEQWAWETFNSLPMIMDAYSDQEKSQLALIQRFLAGGFSLGDHHPYQSDTPPRCTDSYLDAIKDLHQLPWLERFVSVISDTYYDDYIQ